jgi:hypothetical protein
MRVKLSAKHPEQREQICKQIISILDLNESNEFLLCDLDADIDKQQKILDLKEEIKQYFACSTISSFKPNFECKRPYLNIIRSILRQQSYIIVGNDIEMKLEAGIYKRTMKYTISRDF